MGKQNKDKMRVVEGGICAVKGISCLGKNIGIKKEKKDFAVIHTEKPANAVAVYTKNNVKGAPIYVTKKHLEDNKAQAIVINSGISNVATGKKGLEDAELMTKLVADELGIKKEDVLVASTGLIGAYLPMDIIKNGTENIKNELIKNSDDAAEAILTTDIIKKQIAVKVDNITIGAIAKGSGMIHPNMATMLSFIITDADIGAKELQKMLNSSVDKSFNMVSVDHDTSTSDMVILMANGLAGKIDDKKFQKALDFVCIELAKMIAKDGEGATKLIEVKVKNASLESARKIARSIISSNLFKAAVFGNDPNWGRIMAAIGNAGVKIEQNKIDIYFENEKIVEDGIQTDFDIDKVKNIMKNKHLKITVDMKDGVGVATAYGCDLSYDYVKINAAYHT